MTHDGRRRAVLAIDSGTSRVVIATGSVDGASDGQSSWPAGYRHGETLLPTISRFLGEQDIRRSRLVAVVVGTGPGAFTGLRVGIATAKGIAHGLGIPLVGVSTGRALLSAAAMAGAGPLERLVLLLPAGPSDRVLIRADADARLLPAGTEPDIGADETIVAVDLDGRAPEDACRLGSAALDGLGAALLRIGAADLADLPMAPDTDAWPADHEALARVVPDYVTLPRGVKTSTGSIEWSRDPR